MSIFTRVSSRRGASILAALVFVALLGAIAGAMQYAAPKVATSNRSMTAADAAATTPAASTESKSNADLAGCKPVDEPGLKCRIGGQCTNQRCTCAQPNTADAKTLTESCLPGCTYNVEMGPNGTPKVTPQGGDSSMSSEIKSEIKTRKQLSDAQKAGSVGKCTVNACTPQAASGGSSGSSLKCDAVVLGNNQSGLTNADIAKVGLAQTQGNAEAQRAIMSAYTSNQASNDTTTLSDMLNKGTEDTSKQLEQTQSELKTLTDQYANGKCGTADAASNCDQIAQNILAKTDENTKLENQMSGLKDVQGGIESTPQPPVRPGTQTGDCPAAGAAFCNTGTQDGKTPETKTPETKTPTPGPDKTGNDNNNNKNNTFGDGSLSKLFGGSQTPTGQNAQTQNPYQQQQQQQQMCATRSMCQSNTIYYMNQQCQQQPMQYCQYGCDQTGTQCSQTPPAPYGRGTDGQPCQQPPTQPSATACSAGTWTALSATNNTCTTGWKCSTDGSSTGPAPTAQVTCAPQVADVGAPLSVTYACSAGTITATGFTLPDSTTLSGTVSTFVSAPPTGTNLSVYGIVCANNSLTAGAQCNVQVSRPSIVLVANPKTVASGQSSAVGWITSGMQACTVSSPDMLDFTAANANNTSVNGMATTSPITTTVNIVLRCNTLGGATKTATTTIGVQ